MLACSRVWNSQRTAPAPAQDRIASDCRRRPATLNVFPDRIKRIEALARDLWWSWTPPHAKCSVSSTMRCANDGAQPEPNAAAADAEALGRPCPAWWLANYDARSPGSMPYAPHARRGAIASIELTGKQIAYFSAELRCTNRCRSCRRPRRARWRSLRRKRATSVCLDGVGFMYPQGYFHQSLTADGWQQEVHEKLNWTGAPVEPAITPDGKPCITAMRLATGRCSLPSGASRRRVVLFLLDTDLEENAPWDRDLSARCMVAIARRAQQEIILGVGGVRVLKAMGQSRRSIT